MVIEEYCSLGDFVFTPGAFAQIKNRPGGVRECYRIGEIEVINFIGVTALVDEYLEVWFKKQDCCFCQPNYCSTSATIQIGPLIASNNLKQSPEALARRATRLEAYVAI